MVRNDKGLTLIEVLAAITILSFLILVFINISSSTSKSANNTDKKSVALRVAEKTMNQLRSEIYSASDSSGITPNTGSKDSTTTNPEGYQTDVYDILFSSNPPYPTVGLANKVTLTDIIEMYNSTNQKETRLLVVTVSWAG